MNKLEQAQQLIDEVCKYYQIESNGLYNKRLKRPVRLTKMVVDDKKIKVDLSCLRMAVSYYLMLYTDLSQTIIGPLVGYRDHTTLSYSKKKVSDYFTTRDERFLNYWQTVNNIANSLSFSTNMIRVMDSHYIRMIPNPHYINK
jgi:chromosomal replication initiation ATPase DnaA